MLYPIELRVQHAKSAGKYELKRAFRNCRKKALYPAMLSHIVCLAMTTKQDTQRDTKPKTNHDDRLSPDGKWRSFPKVPNLLQYSSTGTYFARVKAEGKLIRRSLDTNVFGTAKLKLGDFIKEQRTKPETAGTFGAALRMHLRGMRSRTNLSDASKVYYRHCIKILLASWPGLRTTPLTRLTLTRTVGDAYIGDPAFQKCSTWAVKLGGEVDAKYFNNTLSQFRKILEIGGIPREKNPVWKVSRQGVEIQPKDLPTLDQFRLILKEMETSGTGVSQQCADFARFLAFSGCRLREARNVTWGCVKGDVLVIERNKRRKGAVVVVTKKVPIIPDMRILLDRIKPANPSSGDKILGVGECEKSLKRACKRVKVSALTHHSLRHFFATVCIENGIPIQTVAHWLGHSDGGVLAMKTYGHVRDEHSAAMAQKVTFGAQKEAA